MQDARSPANPSHEPCDEDLLRSIITRGDRASFAQIVTRHALSFRRVAFRFVNSRDVAEDIVQDAFLKLWRNPSAFDADKGVKFTTWFYRMVVNQCLDHLRREKHSARMPEADVFEDTSPRPDESYEDAQRQAQVEAAFQTLPPNMRTALNLSFYEAIPNKEAADVMGLSLKAFQSLLMRAKTALKDKVLSNQRIKARAHGQHA